MSVVIAAMPGQEQEAARLAHALAVPLCEIHVHRFPDGESRVTASGGARTAVLYCSLNDPNTKLVEAGLAASALRDLGARRVVLVAPYLCYMRQDQAFSRGEAVSQRVIAMLLAGWFERIVTIEPHLHRIASLSEIFPATQTAAISAAPLLAQIIASDGAADRILVGPDAESGSWTRAVASLVGAPSIVMQKTRSGDACVTTVLPPDAPVKDRVAYLIDDVVSTGSTLGTAAAALLERGAARVEACVAHALCTEEDMKRMRRAGVSRLRSTDTAPHPTNAAFTAPLLAAALESELKT